MISEARKESASKYYKTHKAACAARLVKWRIDNKDKVQAQYKRHYYRDLEHSRALGKAHAAKQRERNPQKTKARITLWRAVKRGEVIKKPCEVCGTIFNVEGHHSDYSKPLEAIWLCKKHHSQHHANCKIHAPSFG